MAGNYQSFRFKIEDIGKFAGQSDDCLASFSNDCHIFGMTMGQFSLIDLIHSILKKTGKAKVIVATWSAGIKDVHNVKWMIDSGLIADFKILTDHSYKTRQSKYAASIEELFGLENIRTSEMHAKFVLIQNDAYKVAITSSMNLNANKTCELFEIIEGGQPFDFLMNFVIHHFDNMKNGFTTDSESVSKVVNSYFFQDQPKQSKHWSEL